MRHLSEYHEMPVCAVHAPCLLITQRVWGIEPWGKLEKSAEMASRRGRRRGRRAPAVPLAARLRPRVRRRDRGARGAHRGRVRGGEHVPLAGLAARDAGLRAGWDPSEQDYSNATIDLSHSAVSRSDPVAMARRLGDRLRHIHMTDGTGSAKDEHLVPGRGTQPVAELLEHLAGPVGHVDVPQPVAETPGHRDRVGPGDRGVRQVDRGVGVVLLRRVPARARRPASRAATRARGTCSPPRTRCRCAPRGRRRPPRSRARSRAASGTAGARRPRPRRPRRAISALRSSLPQGSAPQTRWVISRQGACTAHTGISWYSER